MNVSLAPDERLDKLDDMRIIQRPKGFCFGTDSVLLARFACGFAAEEALDIGTGSGVLPLLLIAGGFQGRFTALEVQEGLAGLARRNMELNGLAGRVHVEHRSVIGAHEQLGANRFGMIVTNPPYGKRGGTHLSATDERTIARHEILCTFEDIALEAKKLLINRGHIFLVHRALRAVELFATLERHHLRVKRVKFVHPFADAPANLVLCEAVKNGRQGMRVEMPYVVDGGAR